MKRKRAYFIHLPYARSIGYNGRMAIAVYSGPGTLPFPLPARPLSTSDILNTPWEKTCSLLIMPGGRDRPYHQALQGEGCRRIRRFVENGGTYLGICAGAYFASAQVRFDIGFPLEVSETRELRFFPGSAVGPAYGKGTYDYESNKGARAALIRTPRTSFYAYYNGGCTFEGDLSPCSILARFKELEGEPPAIVSVKVGLGKAILSGVHLETHPASLDTSDLHLAPLIPLLTSTERSRKTFFQAILPRARPPMR
jgi:biotin--protein ligase